MILSKASLIVVLAIIGQVCPSSQGLLDRNPRQRIHPGGSDPRYVRRPDFCYHPPIRATPCRGYFPAWYYSTRSGSCVPYAYGGCGGTENLFLGQVKGLDYCRSTCESPSPSPSRRENFGEDLLALNIQRGRDHGLPGYNAFRKACGLRPMTNWNQRPTELDEKYWDKLKEVYDNVDDIDIYVGGVAEQSVRGGVVGPTFACIIADQFRRLKVGDRFFYTHTNANGLSKLAKDNVLQRTLGDIMCDVTQLGKVQSWVTLQPNPDYNQYKSCSKSRQLDMRAIADEITEELSNPRFQERVRSDNGNQRSLFRSSGVNNNVNNNLNSQRGRACPFGFCPDN